MNYLTGYTATENGALTHSTSGGAVLNFFSLAGAMRDRRAEAVQLFRQAFAENEILALRALFWLRDIRGGAGERQLFRDMLVDLSALPSEHFNHVIRFVPEYGMWDDLIEILDRVYPDHDRQAVILDLIKFEIATFYTTGKGTLLAKWLPSSNAGTRAKHLSRIVRNHLNLNERDYRKMLVQMRNALYLVERDMSANKWNEIRYKNVPSRAAMVYSDAFKRHDEERYIASLTDIKATTLMPYELYERMNKMDERVHNATWNALPDYMNDKNVLVLADVSGSMHGKPMAVSVSLALYAAQRTRGIFGNTFITFETSPRIVQIDPGKTAKQNMQTIESAPWGGSTNIQAAFDLILGIAVRDKVPQDQMPEVLFIISDMEFNQADRNYTQTNNDLIVQKYAAAGYVKPVLVYWNVDARQVQAPVQKHELGAVLISGLSATNFKSVLSLDFGYDAESEAAPAPTITPLDAMLQILNGERYSQIN